MRAPQGVSNGRVPKREISFRSLKYLLSVLISCSILTCEAADHIAFGKGWLTYRPGLSAVTKNPANYRLEDADTFEFRLDHGGCPRGKGPGSYNNCVHDRQRIEAGFDFAKLKTFNGFRSVKKFFRGNLLIPNANDFPDLFRVGTLINQVKYGDKTQPIWNLWFKTKRGEIAIELANGTSCIVDEKYFPRDQWLELEIHVDYSVNDEFVRSNSSFFTYIVNGKTVCSSYFPVITKQTLQDSSKDHLYFKWGIYDAWVSDWLVIQEKNKKYLEQNAIRLSSYKGDAHTGGGKASSWRSKTGNPFDYNWPTKIPTRKIYYTDWKVANTRANLGQARFEWVEDNLDQFPADASPLCAKAMRSWRNRRAGEWRSRAEAQGLNMYICEALLLVSGLGLDKAISSELEKYERMIAKTEAERKKQKASAFKEKLAAQADQIKEQSERREEMRRTVYAMLSDHLDIKAYGRASDSHVLGSQLISFKETRPPKNYELKGREVAKASISGDLIVSDSNFKLGPPNDVFAKNTLVSILREGDSLLLAIKLGDGGNQILANAVKDSHPSCFPEIRFKPKDWLVVPISTPKASHIKKIMCQRNFVSGYGPETKALFDILLNASASVNSYISQFERLNR